MFTVEVNSHYTYHIITLGYLNMCYFKLLCVLLFINILSFEKICEKTGE